MIIYISKYKEIRYTLPNGMSLFEYNRSLRRKQDASKEALLRDIGMPLSELKEMREELDCKFYYKPSRYREDKHIPDSIKDAFEEMISPLSPHFFRDKPILW